MADTVYDYFKQQLGKAPADITLRDLPCESNCGRDCCDVIDAAFGLIAYVDASLHAEIYETTEHAISIKWHG